MNKFWFAAIFTQFSGFKFKKVLESNQIPNEENRTQE